MNERRYSKQKMLLASSEKTKILLVQSLMVKRMGKQIILLVIQTIQQKKKLKASLNLMLNLIIKEITMLKA